MRRGSKSEDSSLWRIHADIISVTSSHNYEKYELTGPRALTFADAIAEIARITGRDIRYISISPDEYRAALLQAQVPQDAIDLVLYLFGTVLDGRNTPVTDGVRHALGRAARDFSEYVQLAAASGVWEVDDGSGS